MAGQLRTVFSHAARDALGTVRPMADDQPSQPFEETSTRRETLRLLVLGLGVAGIVALLHFTPLRAWLDDAQQWKEWADRLGWRAPALFILGSVAGITLGVPRLVLCLAGGALFGFVEGFAVAQISSMCGSYGTFLFARWGGRSWALRRLASYPRLGSLVRQPGTAGIFVLRQLPLPGLAINLGLGLVDVTHRAFLLGSFLGYLPSNAIVSLIGSSMGKDSAQKALGQVTASLVLLALVSVITLHIRRRLARGPQ